MKLIGRFFLISLLLALLSLTVLAADHPAFSLKTVSAELHVQTPSCDEPTATAVLFVTDSPFSKKVPCTVEWFRDGVPLQPKKAFWLEKGAFSFCSFTVCFSEKMPETAAITALVRFGDEARSFSETVLPQNRDAAFYARLKTVKKPYRIDVSRFQNVVLIWAQDEGGSYSILQNAFVCSTGKATPRGTFYTGGTLRWQTLFGSAETNYRYVYGQYATRITDNILFHSVPYYTQSASDLEVEQFNLLGTRASLGCVRLTAEAAKWIADHIPAGTEVRLVDTLELPVRVPVAPKLDLADSRSGWDPTDPDANNPWRK